MNTLEERHGTAEQRSRRRARKQNHLKGGSKHNLLVNKERKSMLALSLETHRYDAHGQKTIAITCHRQLPITKAADHLPTTVRNLCRKPERSLATPRDDEKSQIRQGNTEISKPDFNVWRHSIEAQKGELTTQFGPDALAD
jgi:hypothetical protein